jgi:hypothetical protein
MPWEFVKSRLMKMKKHRIQRRTDGLRALV